MKPSAPQSQPGQAGKSAAPEAHCPPGVHDLHDLRQRTREFARARDWEQFHTPKNLAMALSVEVAELAEHFQWLQSGADAELDDGKRVAIRHELADVLLYLVQLADKMQVDLHAAAVEKMTLNAVKYPAAMAPGDARHRTGDIADRKE